MKGFGALVRFISVRHVLTRPTRALLTLFGVALGVAMVVGMRATNAAVLDSFEELSDRAAGRADLEIAGDESGIDQGLLEELDRHRDVAVHFAGRIEQMSYLRGNAGQLGLKVLVLGIDFFGDHDFVPFTTAKGPDAFGDAIAFVNTPGAVLVTETLARERSLEVGAPLWLRTAAGLREFRVWAVLADSGHSRAFGGQVVVMNLDAAQVGFDRGTRLDRIDVEVAKGLDRAVARERLARVVGDRARVAEPSARSRQIAHMTSSFRTGIELTGTIAVLIGMFLIYNAVGVSVVERRREIGILRSIGMSRGGVAGVFLAEALVLGAVGSALGLLLGRGLAVSVVGQFAPNVSRFYENIASPTVHLGRPLALLGVAIGVVATLLAAWLPAREAARVQPVESLRRDMHATTSRVRRSTRTLPVAAAALALAALVLSRLPWGWSPFGAIFAIFGAAAAITPALVSSLTPGASRLALRLAGPSASLGIENVSRELERSSVSVGALMFAACLSVTLSSYTHSYETSCMEWIEHAIPADVIVSAGSPTIDRNTLAFSPSWRPIVQKVPGVEGTNLIRTLSVPWQDLRLEMLHVESANYFEKMEGSRYRRIVEGPFPTPRDALVREPTVMVSENLAWKKQLHEGDSLTLPSPTGPHTFRIQSVVVDYSTDQGWIMIDRKWALAWWGDELVDAMHVYVTPGYQPEDVATRVRNALAQEAGDDGGLFVTTARVFKDEIREVIRQTFGVAKASEVVALLVAVLGVIGTMLAGVLARTREIGVLRAIGAKRHQIVANVMAESAWLGACAALIGVVAALPASWIFVKVIGVNASGWQVPFLYPFEAAARMTASVIVLSAAAGLVPGLRAARLMVQDALAYE